MPNPAFFQPEFDKLATNGHIGDPKGQPAYAYIRVSSGGQAEEGKDGLPRQIRNIHEKAATSGFRIAWDMVYADDDSGFEFRGRANLTLLRKEYKSAERRGSAVVMEHLDRLSRNADWHQGFLLEEMRQHHVQPVFWKEFNSRIERAVMGAVAQDAMEDAKARMRAGVRKKAENGHVTSKSPALGYKIVDPNGEANTMLARTHSRYSIDDERAEVVRFIFDKLAYGGLTSCAIVDQLDERAKSDPRFKPRHAKCWNERSVCFMVRNSVYKGQLVANRYTSEFDFLEDGHGDVRRVERERQRPEDEWIYVDVPPIVDSETWQRANDNLYKNKRQAKRNTKYEYLLGGGLIHCGSCGYRYAGHTDKYGTTRYYCLMTQRSSAFRALHPCNARGVNGKHIDGRVWSFIVEQLLNPDVLAAAIDRRYAGLEMKAVVEQITYLESQILGCDEEETKLRQAYLSDGYTPEEFAAERRRLRALRQSLKVEADRLRGQLMSPEALKNKKEAALIIVSQAAILVKHKTLTFDKKQRIVRELVDKIVLHSEDATVEIFGVIPTTLLQLGSLTGKSALPQSGDERPALR